MDRLLTWDDLVVTAPGSEVTTIPSELRHEVARREEAFITNTGATFDPLHLLEFAAYGSDEFRAVVVREVDLHGTIGANVDKILSTAPAGFRPDLLVRRGTL